MRQWKQTLNELAGEPRAGLVDYAGAYTSDPAEAAQVVDDALVAVLARRRGPGDTTAVEAHARLEVRRIFGRARHEGSRTAEVPTGQAQPTEEPQPNADSGTLAVRIRRRRLLRMSIVIAAAIGVLGLGTAAVYGVGQLSPVPAPTPTSDSTPTPTPTPTAEPEPEILGPVTVDPQLPEALPLRAGMLEAAGPGWSLVQYENEAVDGGLIYLVSPAGEAYEVPTPLSGSSPPEGRLADWLPGSALVLVEQWRGAGLETDVVDLLSGERLITVHHGLAGESPDQHWADVGFVGDESTDLLVSFNDSETGVVALTVRLRLDGHEVATIEDYRASTVGGGPVLSPDGRRIALHRDGTLRIVNSSDFGEVSVLTSPYPNRPADCAFTRWAGTASVLLMCSGPGRDDNGFPTHNETWVAPVDGGRPSRLASLASSGWWGGAWQVGNDVVVRSEGVNYLVRPGGSLERLPNPAQGSIVASAGSLIYAFDEEHEGYWADQALVAVDVATGTVIELLDAHADYDRISAVVTHGDR